MRDVVDAEASSKLASDLVERLVREIDAVEFVIGRDYFGA